MTGGDLVTFEQPAGYLSAHEALDENAAAVYLAGLQSPSSRRPMKQALAIIAQILGAADILSVPWGALRYQHTMAIRSQLASRYAPRTVNRDLSALRGVLKAAWNLGQMSAEDYHRSAAVASIRGSRLPAGRELPPGEIAALIRICEDDSTSAGVRDAAIISLMYSCGPRRDEVVNLDRQNYEAETGKLLILVDKGGKQRIAHLVDGAADALADWLQLRGDEPGPLFWPIGKSGKPAKLFTSHPA